MATRATNESVTGIIDFDPSIEDLTPFLVAANELVTEICQPAGYSDTRLALIETWLAAHFLAIRDPRYQSESQLGASASYVTQVGLNLSLTPYGQQAQLLDTKGGLAMLDKHISQGHRAKVGVVHVGGHGSRLYDYPYRFYTLFAAT